MTISRKNALKSIIGALITLPVFGKKGAEKDFLAFKKEFSEAWKSSLDYTLKLYNQMPEEKWFLEEFDQSRTRNRPKSKISMRG